MTFPTGWGKYKEVSVTGTAPSGYPMDLRVWKNKPLVIDFGVDSRSDANLSSHQGVCTDGTYWYSTANGDGPTNQTLTKWTKSGDTYTQDSYRDCSSDNGGVHAQINHLIYDAGTDLLIVGANNYSTTPAKGWLYRYDPTDLSFVDAVSTRDLWSEGCCKLDGYLWVVYDDYHGVDRYTITNEAEGSFAISLQESHAFPSSSPGGHLWNGVQAWGDILYVNIHDNDNRIDSYLWDGTDLHWVGNTSPPTADCGQGFFVDANGDWWFAERDYSSGDHRIVKASLTLDPRSVGCDGNCKDDFSDIRITDDSGSTVLCGDGAGWREYYSTGFYAWFHYTLPAAISASSVDVRMYYDQSSPGTWSDDRSTIVSEVEDFEDGTMGHFDSTYSSSNQSIQTATPLEGSYYMDSNAGGRYPSVDETFVDAALKRVNAWAKRTGSTEFWVMKTVSGTTRRRAKIRLNAGDIADEAGSMTSVDPSGYVRLEIALDYDNSDYDARAWTAHGAGATEASTDTGTTQAARAYKDVLLYNPADWDLIYSRDLVHPEPSVGDWGAAIVPPAGASATLSSSSSMTGSAIATELAAGTMSAGSSLTGSANETGLVSALMTAGAALDSSAIATELAAGTMSAGSTLTGAAIRASIAAGTISAGSSLTGAAIRASLAAGTISAGSTFTGSAIATELAEAVISAAAAMTGAGDVSGLATAAATLSSSSSMTGSANETGLVSALMTAGAALDSSAIATELAAGTLSVATLISAIGDFGTLAQSTMSAGTGLSATVRLDAEAQATLTALAELAGEAIETGNVSAELTTTSALDAISGGSTAASAVMALATTLQASAFVGEVAIVTPAGRTLRIQADARTIEIKADDRTVTVRRLLN